ncbi:helicase-exonuclease AddAB subunit AddB [Cohnella sp. CFH 77786]|uniref:helicase-exonuclease AddAB subunit AddB n=1 Tax=Cohnella sp. CFH 77786 TaxID=2662265 RepID=UPI001C60CDC3|nr:helicase-exonuclease AddAB subunit AddB [Cohnella sp. CFH 77786]MBW5444904.1 helicase-exonuclease AddAB subunit AddB [Cohnella sp. CFH 77786]
MPLRLVTGRSGSGKTRYVLDEIRGKLREDPQGPPLILLVPEQATFQAEQAMVGTPGLGGFMRAQVLSFRRLAFRIMQETGGLAMVPIHDNGKAMLLHKVLETRRNELRLFRGGASETGLIAGLNDLLTEWKRYAISSDKLAETSENGALARSASDSPLLADKLHDLAMIYGDMERELAGRWMDGEDMLGRLAGGAASSEWLAEAEIWLDGFHGFTPGELAVIEGLMRRAKRVTVALTVDKPFLAGETPDELHTFHKAAETSARLCELAEACGIPVEPPVHLEPEVSPRFSGNPVLAFLERNWERRSAVWQGDDVWLRPERPECGLSLHAASNRRAEAEAAVRDILRRVREEGFRWRDAAVFVRRMEDYADLLSSVFSDYGIPCYLDGKSSVSHHPLVEFVRSALECVTGGWKSEAVFRCAKTDLLGTPDGRVTRDAIDRLENYALAAGIDGWKWHDDRMWRPLSRGDLEEEEGTGGVETAPNRLLPVRDALLKPLKALENRLAKADSTRALCEGLYLFLEETGAADALESRSREDAAAGQPGRAAVHRPLWDGVMNLLDQLVELMGDTKPDLRLFAGMVDSGLEELKLGAVPPSLDAVLIGSPERTRIDRLKFVYFLGVSDGVLPMRIPENGLLSENERELLAETGLRMAPGSRRRLLDERFLAYLAFTAPSGHLWISWPLADDEGSGLLPSEWIRRLKRRFPAVPVQTEAAEPQPGDPEEVQLAHAVHPGRALTHVLARLRQLRNGEKPSSGWWSVYNWLSEQEAWRSRLKRLVSSLNYRNEEKPLSADTSLLLYGDRLLASVSRMERFVACPFRHFASHGLRLRERRLYRVDAPDIGQLFHAALRQTTEKLFAQNVTGDAGLWQREAAAAVERLLPKVQSQILLSSHRHGVMARKLRDIVAQASAMLGEQARLSAFRPVGLELGFGPDAPLPPLSLDLGGGRTMDIAGRIDRVDAAETPEGLLLRIMDYKSGAVKLKLEEVAHGLTLQMLTYLDVVVTHAPHWLGRPAEPAGVLYFHVRNPLLPTSNGMSAAEAQAAMFRQFRMQGLVLADGDAVKRMDVSLEGNGKSSVVPVEFKKDGTFSSRSQIADRGQWAVLRSSVRGQIRKIGKRIASGDVAIAPYRMDKRSPCAHCEYRPVCQFDPELDGNEYQVWSKPGNREELWRKLGQEAERGEPE